MQKKIQSTLEMFVCICVCVCVWIIHEDSGPQKHLDSVWFCLFFWSNLNKDNGPPSSLSSGTLKLTPLCLSVCVFVSFVCVVHHLSWSFEIYSPIPLHIILDILKHVSYERVERSFILMTIFVFIIFFLAWSMN